MQTYNNIAPATTNAVPALMTSGEVADAMRICRRTLWRLVAADKAPQPVRYNRKLVRWIRKDVEAYLQSLEMHNAS